MSAQTCKRRRRQAVNNYRHLAPLQRPRYKKSDAQTSARKLADRIAREKQMQGRKAMTKK